MKNKQKQFLFMYPIKEYFDVEIEKDASAFLYAKGLQETPGDLINRLNQAKTRDEQIEIQKEELRREYEKFKPFYREMLNRCINLRYRQNDFGINFLVFNDTPVDKSVIDFKKGDRIVRAGLTSVKHFNKKIYPNLDYVLNQFAYEQVEHLRVAGFHAWDCVEKLAKHAHKKGIDVLVDEDLTQFLICRAITDDFAFDKYPGYNATKHFKSCGGFEGFMEPRKGKPWFVQDYP